jgi:hypothetical protein
MSDFNGVLTRSRECSAGGVEIEHPDLRAYSDSRNVLNRRSP